MKARHEAANRFRVCYLLLFFFKLSLSRVAFCLLDRNVGHLTIRHALSRRLLRKQALVLKKLFSLGMQVLVVGTMGGKSCKVLMMPQGSSRILMSGDGASSDTLSSFLFCAKETVAPVPTYWFLELLTASREGPCCGLVDI
jgi:hypothetical protein